MKKAKAEAKAVASPSPAVAAPIGAVAPSPPPFAPVWAVAAWTSEQEASVRRQAEGWGPGDHEHTWPNAALLAALATLDRERAALKAASAQEVKVETLIKELEAAPKSSQLGYAVDHLVAAQRWLHSHRKMSEAAQAR